MPSIEQLEKLHAADPNDTFVLYALAQEHAKAGEHDRAIQRYDQCLAIDPAYCYAYYHKARAQESAGRPEDADATLRAGLDAARAAGDDKALSEIQAFLDEIA